MADPRKSRGVQKEFSEDEVSRAIQHMKARCPEILSMMERRESGEVGAGRDEWTKTMFQLAPVLAELGITASLSESDRLRFYIRREIRKRLGHPT
jgi:hypothetical protein